MPLTVLHQGHREGHGLAGFFFAAHYDVAIDGGLQVGDVVVYVYTSQVTGGGNTFYVEYADGTGPHGILGGVFANLFSAATIFGVPPDAQLIADGAASVMFVNVITPGMLVRDTGEALIRFGWSSQSQYIGTSFGAWVIRGALFNSVPVGSSDATNSVAVGPYPVLRTPAPGEGVLTANQMAFGLTHDLDGGGFGQPAVAVRANWDIGRDRVPTFHTWGSAFGQRNFASDIMHAIPGDDLTGATATLDSVPTGQTSTGADIVGTQTSAMIGLLDLTPVAKPPGFGFGGAIGGP